MSVEPDYCPVCQGSKRVCLPLRRQVSATWVSETKMPTIEENSRYYDCPECMSKAPYTRLSSERVMSFMDSDRMHDKEKEWWREHAVKSMTNRITQHMIEKGFIQFEKIEPDAYHTEGVRATIRAVLPKDVATFEERVAERQMDVATEVAEEAKRRIDNWGSYYSVRFISKDEAHRQISNAVEHVREQRKR